MKKTACKTPFWQTLKAQLNNLDATGFKNSLSQNSDIILLDVRRTEEFKKGSMPGAINISYLTGDLWGQLEILDKNKDIFVFCQSGRRSIRVCTLLRNGGFDNANIFNLDGGLNEYKELFRKRY